MSLSGFERVMQTWTRNVMGKTVWRARFEAGITYPDLRTPEAVVEYQRMMARRVMP